LVEQSLGSQRSECEQLGQQLHTTQEQVAGLTQQLVTAQQVDFVHWTLRLAV